MIKLKAELNVGIFFLENRRKVSRCQVEGALLFKLVRTGPNNDGSRKLHEQYCHERFCRSLLRSLRFCSTHQAAGTAWAWASSCGHKVCEQKMYLKSVKSLLNIDSTLDHNLYCIDKLAATKKRNHRNFLSFASIFKNTLRSNRHKIDSIIIYTSTK